AASRQALLPFRSLDPFRALREPDRRRRDEERLSSSEQRTGKNQKPPLDRKSPIQVRIHLPPAGSLLRTGFRADLQKRVFAFDTIEGIHRIASVTWLGGLHRHYVAFSAKRPRFFSES